MTIYTIYLVTRGHSSRYAAHTSRKRAQERADYLNKGLSDYSRIRYDVIPEFVDDFTE